MASPTILHQKNVVPRSGFFTIWERRRHSKPLHWLIECFAEALGVFFYCYAGVGSTASFVLGGLIQEPTLGSLLQVGFAYAFGILFAIVVCSGTSGGHFNPCVSIALVIFRGFPPLKALRYIVSQIFGGYIACLLIYAQYKDLIKTVEAGLIKKGVYSAINFTSSGPAGIFALYVAPNANLSRVFLNEFVVDTFLGLIIWACLDPSNLFAPPPAIPWIISFAYAVAIWGYAPVGIAANAARDVGGRLAAMSIWGTQASGGTYAALAALANIPAMLLGVLIYEIFLTDSDRVLGSQHVEFLNAHKNHLRSPHRDERAGSSVESRDEKSRVDADEHAHV